jgi:hypothetical protein
MSNGEHIITCRALPGATDEALMVACKLSVGVAMGAVTKPRRCQVHGRVRLPADILRVPGVCAGVAGGAAASEEAAVMRISDLRRFRLHATDA